MQVTRSPLLWLSLPSAVRYQDELRNMSLKVMSALDKVDEMTWHAYRKILDENDFPSRKTAINRAFFKLWELLHPFRNLIGEAGNSLHLAEAPGSFIQVVRLMNNTCNIVGVSKPPSTYADVVRDGSRVPLFSPKVLQIPGVRLLHADLLCASGIASLFQMKKPNHQFDFISADGGLEDKQQYMLKEELHFKLKLTEIALILQYQRAGGVCVLKLFETLTLTTISIAWTLCQHYRSYKIVKPCTSRSTNAERYLICTDFTSDYDSVVDVIPLLNVPVITSRMYLSLHIPASFIEYVLDISKQLTLAQTASIARTLNAIQNRSTCNFTLLRKQKADSYARWKSDYGFSE